jgi:hypothetical protein
VTPPMDRGRPACFTCAPRSARPPNMNRLRPALVLAALAGTLLFATNAAAEKRIYGQSPVAVSNTMNCAAEASMALGAYLLYETGQPIEKTLPVANQGAAAKADQKNTERRLREVYTAKPQSAPAWATQTFQSCLAMKAIPVDYARSGNCYLLTYYLAAVVPLHKANGLDNQAILDSVVTDKAEPAFRARVQALVDEYAGRNPANVRKNNVTDTGRFLQCVSPGKPAVSNS